MCKCSIGAISDNLLISSHQPWIIEVVVFWVNRHTQLGAFAHQLYLTVMQVLAKESLAAAAYILVFLNKVTLQGIGIITKQIKGPSLENVSHHFLKEEQVPIIVSSSAYHI